LLSPMAFPEFFCFSAATSSSSSPSEVSALKTRLFLIGIIYKVFFPVAMEQKPPDTRPHEIDEAMGKKLSRGL